MLQMKRREYESSRKRFWLSTCSTRTWWITQWFEKLGNTIGNFSAENNWVLFRDAWSSLHAHATGDREDSVKWRDARKFHPEQASSSVPKVKETDWRKNMNSLNASPATEVKDILSVAGKMKNIVMLLSATSSVPSLQVWKQMLVAHVGQLMVRGTSAWGREQSTQGSVAILRKKRSR